MVTVYFLAQCFASVATCHPIINSEPTYDPARPYYEATLADCEALRHRYAMLRPEPRCFVENVPAVRPAD